VTEPIGVTFQERDHMEKYIWSRKNYWSMIIGLDLEPAPSSNETLVREEVQRVLELTCQKLGLDYEEVKTKAKPQDFVEARRFAIGICKNRKVTYSVIARALNLHHATVMFHYRRLQEMCDFDRQYRKEYLDIEDYVLIHMAGSYSEDGSGKKLKA